MKLIKIIPLELVGNMPMDIEGFAFVVSEGVLKIYKQVRK